MIRKIAIAALLAMLVGTAGTAAAGSTNAHKNCWLQDYHRLGHIGGVPIEQVWLHPEFDIRNYKILYIPPVQIDPMAYRRRGEPDRAMAQRLAVALRQELVLYTEFGAAVWNDKTETIIDTARNRRHDFFVNKLVVIPKTLAVGRYLLKVSIVDLHANRVAEASVPIVIVAQ